MSLAGVQLKFSAAEKARGGLTIPVTGVGGSWIVKLPSTRFAGRPDGIGRLEGAAYAIRRFDRTADDGRIHMEDFAQVFGVYPADKYRQALILIVARQSASRKLGIGRNYLYCGQVNRQSYKNEGDTQCVRNRNMTALSKMVTAL